LSVESRYQVLQEARDDLTAGRRPGRAAEGILGQRLTTGVSRGPEDCRWQTQDDGGQQRAKNPREPCDHGRSSSFFLRLSSQGPAKSGSLSCVASCGSIAHGRLMFLLFVVTGQVCTPRRSAALNIKALEPVERIVGDIKPPSQTSGGDPFPQRQRGQPGLGSPTPLARSLLGTRRRDQPSSRKFGRGPTVGPGSAGRDWGSRGHRGSAAAGRRGRLRGEMA